MVNSEQLTVSQQKGVFRSNCMDCLDRTNVIQSLLARRSLQTQLQVTPASDHWTTRGRSLGSCDTGLVTQVEENPFQFPQLQRSKVVIGKWKITIEKSTSAKEKK